MRHGLTLFSTLCITTLSLGCGSSDHQGTAKKNPAAGQGQAVKTWALQLDSKCAADAEEGECLAQYGFTVTSEGKWMTGKSPKGYERSGQMSQEDLTAVEGALEKALQKAPGQSLQMISRADAASEESEAAPGAENEADTEAAVAQNEDTLTLIEGSAAPQVLVKTMGTDVNSNLSSPDEAKALHASIRNLAARYIADFPNDCVDGGSELQALMGQLQACTSDADCTYISNLMAVDTDGGEAVLTDRGTTINPLAVANKAAFETNFDKLNSLFNEVEYSCGDKFYREDALGTWTTFVANGKAPECKANVCQINSGVQYY